MQKNWGKPNRCKTQIFEGKSMFRFNETRIFCDEWKVADFFSGFAAVLCSFAELSSLMPYIARISTEHVSKDLCFQARIQFSRLVFGIQTASQETF